MKDIYLFGIIATIIFFSAVTLVYAHNEGLNLNEMNHYTVDEMNAMHDQVMQTIDNPELAEAMDEMHDNCIQSMNENNYNDAGGSMMGDYNKGMA